MGTVMHLRRCPELAEGAVLKMAALALAYAWVQVGLLAETVVTFELISIDIPTDVSADGSVIVGRSSALGAFVWEENHGARSLADILSGGGIDLSEWYLVAKGVSDDGKTIVGYGIRNGAEDAEAFVAVIPEPGAVGLMGIGSGILLFTRRHRRLW